jgi:hypothetical protein
MPAGLRRHPAAPAANGKGSKAFFIDAVPKKFQKTDVKPLAVSGSMRSCPLQHSAATGEGEGSSKKGKKNFSHSQFHKGALAPC